MLRTSSSIVVRTFSNMSRKPRVFVTHSEVPYKGGLELLKEKCQVDVFCDEKTLTRAQILEGVKDVDAIFWFSKEKVDKEILDAAGANLKVIATMTVGYDHIDVAEVKSRGIKLGNTPDVLNNAVAELAIGLMLATARRFTESRQVILDGKYETFSPVWMVGQEICDSVVGIVGLGGIGQSIARRLLPFEPAKIVYTGHGVKPQAKEFRAEFLSLDELLKVSDFIVVACPLTEETKEMFNAAAFSKMKSNAMFINIGRGGIVDQPALIEALESRKIYGAGLDVTTPEPLPSTHPLLDVKNLVLMPHLGSATLKTRTAMARLTALNILAGLEGKPLPSPI